MSKTKTVHERMAIIKHELSKCKIPKTGHNKYAGFKYHELTDFMPFINDLNFKYGVNTMPKFLKKEGICVLKIVSTSDGSDSYEIVIPYVEAEMLSKGGGKSSVDSIQRLGSTITYNRRYLYMAAYDVTESDSIDAAQPVKMQQPPKPPVIIKPFLNKEHEKWDQVVKAVKEGLADSTRAKQNFQLTKETEDYLNELHEEAIEKLANQSK